MNLALKNSLDKTAVRGPSESTYQNPNVNQNRLVILLERKVEKDWEKSSLMYNYSNRYLFHNFQRSDVSTQ